MEGVESVTQIDDTHLHWVAEIARRRKEWDAEITEQHPDERVAWRAMDGTTNAGVVTFHRLDDSRTRVMVQLEHEPEGCSRRPATCWASTSAASRATCSASRR